MRRNMNPVIFSAVLLLITLGSCKPQKAIELKAAIDQKERTVFNILAGKNGSEEKKLAFLIKDDYKSALAAVDQQEKEFDQLIKEIHALPTEGTKQGDELKAAAANYYNALKELHLFDRQEIVQREASLNSEGEALRAAQHKILELGRQKQVMFQKVYERESAFHQAMEKFNSVNGI